MAEQTRATIGAIVEETTVGVLKKPTAATDFIPLRSGGFSQDPQIEILENNELIAGTIGEAKGVPGKENPTGSLGIYVKHTGTPNTAPKWSLLLKSIFGTQTDHATEYNTVASSTTTSLNVDTGEGAQFIKGQAVMVKDTAAGRTYSIRNVKSITNDALELNFALSNAPAAAIDLGKANTLSPAATGHKSFSEWLYQANGAAIEASAGNRVSSATITADAAGQLEATFNFSGTKYYFNPIEVDASSCKIDFKDDSGSEVTATLTTGFYRPEELATEVDTRMEAAGAKNYTCAWAPLTGKFTITSDGSALDILWATGTNNVNAADTILGFSADITGALTYTGAEKTWAAAYTPSYDTANVSNIVVKNAELFIGSQTDNVCVKASNVSIAIEATLAEILSLCATSGVLERPIVRRSVTMTVTTLLEKHRSDYINSLLNASGLSAMLNCGQKDGSGNWTPGQCFNVYLGNATIQSHVISGDDYRTVSITAKGYVTSTLDDIYVNFI